MDSALGPLGAAADDAHDAVSSSIPDAISSWLFGPYLGDSMPDAVSSPSLVQAIETTKAALYRARRQADELKAHNLRADEF